MTALTIPVATLRRLAGIDAEDTGQDAAIQAVRDGEQGVIEYALDPAALTAAVVDDGLNNTLVLGMAELLAGRYLEQTARAPGALDDFKLGPLTLTASRAPGLVALAQQLARHGAARLAPWSRAPVPVTAPDLLTMPSPTVGLVGTLIGSTTGDGEGLP